MPGRLPADIPEYGAAVPAARIPGGVSAFARRVFGRSILRFAAQRREASFQGKRGERRVVSTGDDGPGRAASESCGRFRRAAHVFVCRFDLADSCGFRPDGPVLSPAFENMRIVRAIMFFNVPNNVRTRDFAPAGCGSQSQAAHPVRTLPRILAAGGGLVQGAERIGNSTVGTEKINEARKARRTYRAADTGM